MKKYAVIPFEVEAVEYQKGQGLEDGFLVYETLLPEEGHFGVDTKTLDESRHTVICAAVYNFGQWIDVNPGDYIVVRQYPGRKEKSVWSKERFEQEFVVV